LLLPWHICILLGVCEKGPDILDSLILEAIKEMKENRALGMDEIPAEFLKALGEHATMEMIQICKKMYEKGTWPQEFKRLETILIKKKANAMECGDYRTLSLICHASKILLKVLNRRIENKAKAFIGENQFGFRKGHGTREAIGVLRTL